MWPMKKKHEPVDVAMPVVKKRVKRWRKHQSSSKKWHQRFFEAAGLGRLNASWTTQAVSADEVVYAQSRALRARSRDQVYNNDFARRFISMIKTNVVGAQGIKLQSQAKGRDNQPDRKARQAIEAAYKDWSKAKHCDVKGRLSWREMQSLAIATVAIDGEVLIREHMLGKYGLQYELIDAELLDVDHNTKYKTNEVRFSIEYDAMQRVVAYHVSDRSDGPYSYTSSYNSKKYTRIPANEIIHLYLADFVDQKRGLPWMATTLQQLKHLDSIFDSALTASRAGAAKMGFFSSENGDEYVGEVDDDGNIIEEFQPGYMQQLPAGMTFSGFDPTYPAGEFEQFTKACLRSIASGLSISYNTLANDLENVNFSSMRHGAIEEREIWKHLQAWLIESLMVPSFERWVSLQLSLGTITVPNKTGGSKELNRTLEECLPCNFIGRRWAWIDPVKDISAKKEEIALGVSSISSVIRELGKDSDEVWDEIARERELLNELGLTFGEATSEQARNDIQEDQSGDSDT